MNPTAAELLDATYNRGYAAGYNRVLQHARNLARRIRAQRKELRDVGRRIEGVARDRDDYRARALAAERVVQAAEELRKVDVELEAAVLAGTFSQTPHADLFYTVQCAETKLDNCLKMWRDARGSRVL